MTIEKTKLFFRDNWKNILLVVFFFIIIILVMSTTCTNQKLGKAETNIKALTDTLHTYELKNGKLLYEKQGFIAEKKELEEYIGVKEKEVKEIEIRLKSALATIAKLQGLIHVDTIHTVDSVEVLPDSTYNCHFNYNDRWLGLDGVTSIQLDPFQSHTIINNINMEVPLKVGTTKDDKWFVTSENPYVRFTSVEGANLEKVKAKRWSLGVQAGVGAIFGYGISGCHADGIVRTGWIVGAGGYVGIGLTYKLIEF
jgi:hypothetical protein